MTMKSMTDDDELLSRDRSIMFGISHIGTRAKAATLEKCIYGNGKRLIFFQRYASEYAVKTVAKTGAQPCCKCKGSYAYSMGAADEPRYKGTACDSTGEGYPFLKANLIFRI